jgi:hypothetical protein
MYFVRERLDIALGLVTLMSPQNHSRLPVHCVKRSPSEKRMDRLVLAAVGCSTYLTVLEQRYDGIVSLMQQQHSPVTHASCAMGMGSLVLASDGPHIVLGRECANFLVRNVTRGVFDAVMAAAMAGRISPLSASLGVARWRSVLLMNDDPLLGGSAVEWAAKIVNGRVGQLAAEVNTYRELTVALERIRDVADEHKKPFVEALAARRSAFNRRCVSISEDGAHGPTG